ncbi:MAG: hypothetical protein J4F99_04610 [Acidimicrobiia bacterium]|nr:hypothetical protein [Acidimicrobiia bacterium]
MHRSGDVSCWGGRPYGQIGDGQGKEVPSPKRIPGLQAVCITPGLLEAVGAPEFGGGLGGRSYCLSSPDSRTR